MENQPEIYEYELIDICFQPEYELQEEDAVGLVCEDEPINDADTTQIEYDADGIPMGKSMEDIRKRQSIIVDFLSRWREANTEGRISFKNVKTDGYSAKDSYEGVRYWYLDFSDDKNYNVLEDLIESGIIPHIHLDMYENEYLIIKDTNNPIIKKDGTSDYQAIKSFVKKGNKLIETNRKAIKNQWIDKIFPRNSEQECLFDALQNSANTIVHAGGRYGSGY